MTAEETKDSVYMTAKNVRLEGQKESPKDGYTVTVTEGSYALKSKFDMCGFISVLHPFQCVYAGA